jgi:hypothetical protein
MLLVNPGNRFICRVIQILLAMDETVNIITRAVRRIPAVDTWYLFFLSIQILLVWLLPYFPSQDGPSHIYNAVILHDLLQGGPRWGEFFSYELKAIPNLGFNLIVYPLLTVVSPLAAEKLFLTIYLILLGYAISFLLRTFAPARPRTVQLLAIPVMFNFNLMMGFYSYVIAIPAFLIALSLAWLVRTKPVFIRFICYNLAGVIIFYLHLIPFIFYLIALAVFATIASGKASIAIRSLLRQTALLLPLLALLVSYLSSGTDSRQPTDLSYLFSVDRLLSLVADLLTFSTSSLSLWQLLPATTALFVVLLLLFSRVKERVEDSQEIASGSRAMLLVAAILTGIYFLAPFRFGGGCFFNERFPWVILLVLLPALACASAQGRLLVRNCLAAAAAFSVVCNVVVLRQQANEVETFLAGLPGVCAQRERILLYRTSRTPLLRVDVLLHAPSYYGIFEGCVDLGNYETRSPLFPVHFRRDMGPLPKEAQYAYGLREMDFTRYPAIGKVLGWDLKPKDKRRLGELFTLSYQNDRLSIWSKR